jgi:hypothetical protein
MNILHKIVPIVFLLAPALSANAQQVYNLDLESSIQLAKEKSRTMQILQQSLKKASYDLKAATSTFKTHVSMDMVIPQYTNTIRQWEDSTGISFYPVRQNQMNSYLTKIGRAHV